MSLIHVLILAKAAEEYNKRTGAKSSSKKKSESKKDYGHSSHDKTVGMETFLEDLLETDPEATKLFLLLKDCKSQIDKEDYQKSLEDVQEICLRYEEQDKLLDEEIKKVEATGVTIDSTSVTESHYCSVKVADGRGFGGYGSYSYNPARYFMGFNGMPLTREMLENNLNQFQIDLDKFNKDNPNLDTQLTEITTKITKQRKKIKYSPFNKSKNQSLLTDMLKVEKEIKKKIDERTTLEKRSASFAALTEEQIKAILSYMDQVANCIVVGEELSNAINASIAINTPYYGNTSAKDRNLSERMIARATEQSDFTIESIDAIIERINTTMEEHKVAYGYNRYERLKDQTYTVYPTSPESMFAAMYFKDFYQAKTKTKK